MVISNALNYICVACLRAVLWPQSTERFCQEISFIFVICCTIHHLCSTPVMRDDTRNPVQRILQASLMSFLLMKQVWLTLLRDKSTSLVFCHICFSDTLYDARVNRFANWTIPYNTNVIVSLVSSTHIQTTECVLLLNLFTKINCDIKPKTTTAF